MLIYKEYETGIVRAHHVSGFEIKPAPASVQFVLLTIKQMYGDSMLKNVEQRTTEIKVTMVAYDGLVIIGHGEGVV